MRNLIDFLKRHGHWLIFVALEVISMVLLFRHNSYQGSVWFSSANVVVGKVYEWKSGVTQYYMLREINDSLNSCNLFLQRQIYLMADEARREDNDTTRLRRLQATALDGYTIVRAKVVNNSVDKLDNLITIDKGRADGVEKDMGVANGFGVVGIVYMVSEHYSVVIPVLNSHSNISCMVLGRDYFGYLRWSGGRSDEAYLDDVPRHARFRKGDIVVTSGYSSVFPRGIVAGTIAQVYNSADGLSYRMKVKLSVDFGCLRDVVVLSDKDMTEKRALQSAALDSLTFNN